MYEASPAFGGEITKLEFLRKTKSGEFVVYKTALGESRRAVKSDWCPLFDTFDEAKRWLINRIENEINNIRDRLEKQLPLQLRQEKSRLANVMKIKETDCK